MLNLIQPIILNVSELAEYMDLDGAHRLTNWKDLQTDYLDALEQCMETGWTKIYLYVEEMC